MHKHLQHMLLVLFVLLKEKKEKKQQQKQEMMELLEETRINEVFIFGYINSNHITMSSKVIVTRIDCEIATNCLNLMILVSIERRHSYLSIPDLIVNFAELDGNLQLN